MYSFDVYILASQKNGTLYIGITNDVSRRTLEHKHKLTPGFAAKDNVNLLVYCEELATAMDAIRREKQLKTWQRDWKIKLIEKCNPLWKDLYTEEFSEESF